MTNYLDSYKSLFLDIKLKDFWTIFSLIRNEKNLPSYEILTKNLIDYWYEKNHYQNFYYIPLLCVRTGFDLFLRSKQFPQQSEIIMSAINIPSMINIVQSHQLNVIPCDINIDTLEINLNQLKYLITSKTVAIVYAHIYGRSIDVTELINIAYEYNLYFIEDCAENFSGFCNCSTHLDFYCPKQINKNFQSSCYLGHPRSHLILFSFGVIKYCTSLGGGIAKISDQILYNNMLKIYHNDPIQNLKQYTINVKKYFYLYWVLNIPYVIKPLMYIIRFIKFNHMEYVINRLRAFSQIETKEQLFLLLRRQPCQSLLAFLNYRFKNYDYKNLNEQKSKCLYVLNRLEKNPNIKFIGMNCKLINFWLFPIIVSKPDLFVKLLSKYHIDAYRGTTQLNVITKLITDTDYLPISIDNYHKCPNAEYLIENVIYLPVHCYVPKQVLDQLIEIVNKIAKQIEQYHLKAKL